MHGRLRSIRRRRRRRSQRSPDGRPTGDRWRPRRSGAAIAAAAHRTAHRSCPAHDGWAADAGASVRSMRDAATGAARGRAVGRGRSARCDDRTGDGDRMGPEDSGGRDRRWSGHLRAPPSSAPRRSPPRDPHMPQPKQSPRQLPLRPPRLGWWLLLGGGMALFTVVSFAPDRLAVLADAAGTPGPIAAAAQALQALGHRSAGLLRAGWWTAIAVHAVEAGFAWRLCAQFGAPAHHGALWAAQTLLIGAAAAAAGATGTPVSVPVPRCSPRRASPAAAAAATTTTVMRMRMMMMMRLRRSDPCAPRIVAAATVDTRARCSLSLSLSPSLHATSALWRRRGQLAGGRSNGAGDAPSAVSAPQRHRSPRARARCARCGRGAGFPSLLLLRSLVRPAPKRA